MPAYTIPTQMIPLFFFFYLLGSIPTTCGSYLSVSVYVSLSSQVGVEW